MAYIALYRKYRSQSFGEVLGQEHVTTVLQNALRLGRIAHAYLFCGPRGCGKTSTARLLARALNCIGADGSLTAPTPEPCGVCAMCRGIREGSAMDVVEMDAASETGIDDVREKIIETTQYAPAEARYKVYIIDEVHDLSLKAFDSLLKTIEEPPAHVIFLLATTEKHKVPITIRSRCQQMDFRRATLDDLTRLLRDVLDRERIAYELEAVAAVARAAEGSFRDSLSLLEQTLAYTDGTLTADAVHASIGTVGTLLLDEVTRTLASDDRYTAWSKAGELVNSGKDVKQTLIALQSHLRDVMVASVTKSSAALPDVTPERFAQLQEQAGWFPAPALLRMLDILAETERELRFTNQHRLLLETAFWKILPSSLQVPALAPAAVVRPVPLAPASSVVLPVEKSTETAGVKSLPDTPEEAVSVKNGHHPAEAAPPQEVSLVETPAVSESEAKTSDAVEAEPTTPVFADSIDLEGIRRVWTRIRKRILSKARSAAAYFGDEEVLALEGNVIVLGFQKAFTVERVDTPKGRQLIEQMVAQELGVEGIKVRCVLASAPLPVVVPPEPDLPAQLDIEVAITPNRTAAPGTRNALYDDIPTEAAPKLTLDHYTKNGTNGTSPAEPAPAPASEPVKESAKPSRKKGDQEFLDLVIEELQGRLLDDE